MGNYDFQLDMQSEDTNPKIIKQIEDGRQVLEFGSANGRMTRYLTEQKKCMVDIVELDEQSGQEAARYARKALLGNKEGNIETLYWFEQLKDRQYNYILFADVLEHLRNPQKVLEMCISLLAPQGQIIVSTPNIANNAIITQLLQNEFNYQATGILDSTHVHFFTQNTFSKMVEDIGLSIANIEYIYHDVTETEFNIHLDDLNDIQKKVIYYHPEGCIYQFVFTLNRQTNMVLEPQKWKNQVKIFFGKVFWTSDAENFTEKESKVEYLRGDRCEFEISIEEEISALRLDPLNTSVAIRIEKVIFETIEGEREFEYVTNGLNVGQAIIFSQQKGQILFKNVNMFVKKVVIQYRILEMGICNHLYHEMVNENQKKEMIENSLKTREINLENNLNEMIQKNSTLLYERDELLQQKNMLLQKSEELQKEYHELSEKHIELQQEYNVLSENYIYLQQKYDKTLKAITERIILKIKGWYRG